MQEILECIVELFFELCQATREFFCFHKSKDFYFDWGDCEEYSTVCTKCGKILDEVLIDKEGNVL